MRPQPFVRLVVVNYDGGDVTWRCLQALADLEYPKDRYEVVIIDNASIDGLIWRCRSGQLRLQNLKIIENLTNEGFARGNNLAFENLQDVDLVGLINNDAFPHPTWLKALVSAINSDADIGAVTSKMLFNQIAVGLELQSDHVRACVSGVRINSHDLTASVSPDERFVTSDSSSRPTRAEYWFQKPASFALDCSGFSFPLSLSIRLSASSPCTVTVRNSEFSRQVDVTSSDIWHEFQVLKPVQVLNSAGGGLFDGYHGGDIGFREIDLGQFDSRCEVFSFCGGAALLKSEFLADVGVFDPNYFLYYEDFDLSWRGRFAGWKILYEPGAVVWHEHAFSSKEGSVFFRFWVDRNRRLTLIKNAPARVAMKAFAGAVVWGLRDAILPVAKACARLRKPPVKAASHRLRQLGSFLKATPTAYKYRRRQLKRSDVRPEFVNQWTMTRFDRQVSKGFNNSGDNDVKAI